LESDAGLNWIALEVPNSAVDVVSITEMSTGTAQSLTLIPYNGDNSVFAYSEPLLKSFSGNAPEDICNLYVIKAVLDECGSFDLTARTGWNCSPYDEPNWTPSLYAPCTSDSLTLSVTTLEGSIDAEVTSQPTSEVELCEVMEYEILVRNTDEGYIYDMVTEIYFPLVGVEFVPNSFEITYTPSGTSATIPDPTLQGTTIRGITYEYPDFSNLSAYLDAEGLQGFNALTPADSNEFVISFEVVTTCNFVVADIVEYSFQGNSGCQDPTNQEFGETFPIFVEGIPVPQQFFLADFGPSSTIDDTGSGVLEVNVTNITNLDTDNNDFIRVILPSGIVYTPSSSSGVNPVSWIPGEPTISTVSGFQVLLWRMPVGVPQNGEIDFTFDVTGSLALQCDLDLTFSLFTLDQETLDCPRLGTTCEIFQGTTEGGEQFLSVPIGSGILFDINATSECLDNSGESVTVDINIQNLPTLASGGSYDIYYDANQDGEVDAGDVLLDQITITAGTSGNQSYTTTFTADFTQICDLIGVINATEIA
ncbi:MAG: hypothetical protein ACPG5P_04805, partial [Saprospiraceae bacterium]